MSCYQYDFVDSDPIAKAKKYLAEGSREELEVLHIVLSSLDDNADPFESSEELYYLQELIPAAKKTCNNLRTITITLPEDEDIPLWLGQVRRNVVKGIQSSVYTFQLKFENLGLSEIVLLREAKPLVTHLHAKLYGLEEAEVEAIRPTLENLPKLTHLRLQSGDTPACIIAEVLKAVEKSPLGEIRTTKASREFKHLISSHLLDLVQRERNSKLD